MVVVGRTVERDSARKQTSLPAPDPRSIIISGGEEMRMGRRTEDIIASGFHNRGRGLGGVYGVEWMKGDR